jgi:hypothetical protein
MLIAVRVWILLSTLLVASGWILSAFHQLNRAGYSIVFVLAAATAFLWWNKAKWRPGKTSGQWICIFQKRFRRPAPFLFLALLALSLVAGSIYTPLNGDSLAYRVPRVLHWLGMQQWHWIHTFDPRMNFPGCGFEWLSAPLILFGRSDRLIFLINIISYAMLPGLVYSVFKRLGVSPRVAWWWMWLLPSGWCFVFQASSVVNDCFAGIYALAAVDLALRAKEKGSLPDLWLSILAAALVTAAKQTNIPLVLLWLIAASPAMVLLKRNIAGTVLTLVLGLLASILPITVLNIRHTGNWLGTGAFTKLVETNSPVWGIIGNAFCLPVQNLMPPFIPWADKWNLLMKQFVATPFGHHFASFEYFGQLSFGSHSIGEGDAGIGLGICLLALASVFTTRRISKNANLPQRADAIQLRLLRYVPWLLLLVFMAEDLAYENARQLSPYYAFFLPCILVMPGQALLVRQRWWRWSGLLLMLLTVGLVVISRNRPLVPMQTILQCLHAGRPDSRWITRLEFSFASNQDARKLDQELIKNLPPDEKLIGYGTVIGSAEPDFWFPLGQRRVQRLTPDDTPDGLRTEGIRYVVVDSFILDYSRETIGQWMGKFRGELVEEVDIQTQPGLPPIYLYLVRLQP